MATAVRFNTATSYLDLPSDTYRIAVTLTGTIIPLITRTGVELGSNTNYTIFAVDADGGGEPQSLVIKQYN